jgi:hypothetical protein
MKGMALAKCLYHSVKGSEAYCRGIPGYVGSVIS